MRKQYMRQVRSAGGFLAGAMLLGVLAGCGAKVDVPPETSSVQETATTPETTTALETTAASGTAKGAETVSGLVLESRTNEEPAGHTFYASETEGSPVYMTRDISPEGLMAVYKALNREASGKVAVKLSMGEPGGEKHYFLSPDLIKELVQQVDGTIVDCNTAYGGRRANTAKHRQVAEDHGFTAIAPVDILDEEGSISLPVDGGAHLKEDMVGSHYDDYDFVMVLSHFKGHEMGGFGGALKNISIGFASQEGKNYIHSGGNSRNSWRGGTQDDFLESMAEAAKAVAFDKGENILYISVMNNMSIDCDCNGYPAEPDMADIGILASLDPVALDQACVDLVYGAEDGASLIERIEAKNGILILEYAEKIGLGSRTYRIVDIDE